MSLNRQMPWRQYLSTPHAAERLGDFLPIVQAHFVGKKGRKQLLGEYSELIATFGPDGISASGVYYPNTPRHRLNELLAWAESYRAMQGQQP